MQATQIIQKLESLADPKIAEHSARFFKTGKGDYGEGDRFLGIRVPVLRKHLRLFEQADLDEISLLLKSPFHEIRLFAVLLLVRQYQKPSASESRKGVIYGFYLDHSEHINNWDLIDTTAPHIVGAYLFERDKVPLYQLVESSSIWERRIAIIASLYFIKQNRYADTLMLAERLVSDPEDLIHKAVGWMLREVGKRDQSVEERFLQNHYRRMPRTMLRYAIERFPERLRQAYLNGEI